MIARRHQVPASLSQFLAISLCLLLGASCVEEQPDTLSHFSASLALEQESIIGSPFTTISSADLAKVATLRRAALTEARKVDPQDLLQLDKGLPQSFLEFYIPSLELWIEGYEEGDLEKMNKSTAISWRWGEIYRAAYKRGTSR